MDPRPFSAADVWDTVKTVAGAVLLMYLTVLMAQGCDAYFVLHPTTCKQPFCDYNIGP